MKRNGQAIRLAWAATFANSVHLKKRKVPASMATNKENPRSTVKAIVLLAGSDMGTPQKLRSAWFAQGLDRSRGTHQ